MQDAPPQNKAGNIHWLPLAFVCAAAVSAVWVLGSPPWFATWHCFPNTASTTLLFLASVAFASRSVAARYKWGVVAGLGFSAAGDAFLMIRDRYFVAGLASFLAAHICYLWAFTHDSRLGERRLPFLAWGAWGMVLVAWVWPGLAGPLRAPVILYTAALLAMAAQATGRAASKRNAPAILAAAGAALFAISDSALAFQRFRHPLPLGHLIVLGTYFAAQGGIALSAVLRSDGPARPLH